MADDLDPAAVERVARAVFPYVRCGACRIAPHSPCMDCADRAHNAAWSALAAARAGEPAAPTVSEEQLRAAVAPQWRTVFDNRFAESAQQEVIGRVMAVLTDLGIEVTP